MIKNLEFLKKVWSSIFDDVKFRICFRILTNYWHRTTNTDFWRSI